ncbi:MAG TPA: hypothetical protein DCE41_37600, partial [Cytophagales bacterium]|nr:hypothetical protein [Cytophagales bacterium]
ATTIEFSTDVQVEGKALPAGRYGFHLIPTDNRYRLLFVQPADQWGSYYLDLEQDVVLEVTVQGTETEFSEKLDYEFDYAAEDALVIALEWADRRVPFRVSVDLEETVMASFRSELRGLNTYRWQAWNDAARWCLNHDTHLEEALTFANRSIEGGYNGFAANKNANNMGTKMELLVALERTEEALTLVNEFAYLEYSPYDAAQLIETLLRMQQVEKAAEFTQRAMKKHPNEWVLELRLGQTQYLQGNARRAVKTMQGVLDIVPLGFRSRLEEVIAQMEAGDYRLPALN